MLHKMTLFKLHQKMLQIHIQNTTVTENVQSVHLQLQHKPSVAFKIPSQPCQSIPEAGGLRLSSTIAFGFGWCL